MRNLAEGGVYRRGGQQQWPRSAGAWAGRGPRDVGTLHRGGSAAAGAGGAEKEREGREEMMQWGGSGYRGVHRSVSAIVCWGPEVQG